MNIEIKKRSKAERLVIAGSLIASIYSELLSGDTDDTHNLLQLATMVQVDINRIVWWLNDKNNKHTDHDKRCLQAKTHDIRTNTHACVKDEPQTDAYDSAKFSHNCIGMCENPRTYMAKVKDEPQTERSE